MVRGSCFHFNGIQHKTCDAGIAYDSVRPVLAVPVVSQFSGETITTGPIPCFRKLPNGTESPDTCPQRRWPTQDEIDAREREITEAIEQIGRVMIAIKPWRTWSKKNRVAKHEVIECPECKGRLHLSQAAYNGHVHGKCETEGCVSWME